MDDLKEWIEEARLYLDEEYTQHLYKRAMLSEDPQYISRLIKKAKAIWATLISEADTLINKTPN